jgi:tetraacyldisaccharide 4'-kinase
MAVAGRGRSSADIAGDEPLLIVQRTGVPLMIDPDRSAVKSLLASEPLDLILSDDGMQHYRLARDLELVLIDAARGLGNQRCLPAGRCASRSNACKASMRCSSTAPWLIQTVSLSAATHRAGQSAKRRAPSWITFQARRCTRWPDRQSATFLQDPRNATLAAVPHAFADHAEYSVQALNFTPSLPLVMTERTR